MSSDQAAVHASRVTVASGMNIYKAALKDLREGFAMRELWLFLGWQEIRRHYARSILGPLWLTLSMGVMIGALGFLYSKILRTDIAEYLPFLATGLIVWNFISATITSSSRVFSNEVAYIRQVRLPMSLYIYKLVWGNLITFFHNFVIYVVVLAIFRMPVNGSIVLFVPALLVLALNGVFIAMLLGPLCARFRDIPPLLENVLQILFFLTPIIWSAKLLPQRTYFVDYNLFYHFIAIARQSLLGGQPLLLSWIVCLVTTAILGIGAFVAFARVRGRIAYWV